MYILYIHTLYIHMYIHIMYVYIYTHIIHTYVYIHNVCIYIYTHIHIMDYYSDIEKNEILPFAAAWVDLEGIVLSEISQTENEK